MTLQALAEEDLAAWIAQSRTVYIEARVVAGDTAGEATANADTTIEQMFPGGSPGPGQLVARLMADERAVGWLWIGPAGSDPTRWWVWDIVIDEDVRGRGYGRTAMRLAEELARDKGATSLGLNVFAENTIARTLYASIGYTETSVQMRKALVR